MLLKSLAVLGAASMLLAACGGDRNPAETAAPAAKAAPAAAAAADPGSAAAASGWGAGNGTPAAEGPDVGAAVTSSSDVPRGQAATTAAPSSGSATTPP